METVMRCKMRVKAVKHTEDRDGKIDAEFVTLHAVYGEDGSENAQWSKWTPSGAIELLVNNPDAFGLLPVDREFYIDFTPAK